MIKYITAHENLSFTPPEVGDIRKASKGQTTMVLIMLVLVLFAGTAIFLLTFAKNISQTDYMNLYVHNLLLTLMRSDTGYTDPNCKLVSDALSCAFFSPDYICSGGSAADAARSGLAADAARSGLAADAARSGLAADAASYGGPSCLELANRTATEYIEKFSMVKKSYRYLLTVEPQGFTVLGPDGEPFKIVIGDQGVAAGRQTKYTANEQMRKATSSGVYNLNAKLVITAK